MSNARGHVVPEGTDSSVTRQTIFESFGNSIRDVVAVANATERAQLVTDLTAESEAPSSTKPLVVHRADAAGLHRIEYTSDGAVFLPASGLLRFADNTARDSWTTSHSGLLAAGDRCVSGSAEYRWNGTAWKSQITLIQSGTVVTTDEPTTARQSLSFAFPEPFAAAPLLMVSSYISTGGNRVIANQSIQSTTASTGVIFYTADSNYSASSQATFSWVALGVA